MTQGEPSPLAAPGRSGRTVLVLAVLAGLSILALVVFLLTSGSRGTVDVMLPPPSPEPAAHELDPQDPDSGSGGTFQDGVQPIPTAGGR